MPPKSKNTPRPRRQQNNEAAAGASSTNETPPPNELQEALAVIEKLRQQLKEKERTDIVQQNTSINSGDALSNMRRHNIAPRLKQQQNTSTNNGDALSNTDGANFPLGLPSLGFADMLHVLRYVSTQ